MQACRDRHGSMEMEAAHAGMQACSQGHGSNACGVVGGCRLLVRCVASLPLHACSHAYMCEGTRWLPSALPQACGATAVRSACFAESFGLVLHSWEVSSLVCARNDLYVWCVCGMVAGIVGWQHLLVSSTANTSTTPQHLLVSSTDNISTGISQVGRHRDQVLPPSPPIYGLDADWDLWAEVSFFSLRLSLRLCLHLSPCLSPCLSPTISLPVYLSPPSLSLRVLLSLFGAWSSLAMPLSRPPSLSPSFSLLTLPRGCARLCEMSVGHQLMCVALHCSVHIDVC